MVEDLLSNLPFNFHLFTKENFMELTFPTKLVVSVLKLYGHEIDVHSAFQEPGIVLTRSESSDKRLNKFLYLCVAISPSCADDLVRNC